MSKEFSGAEALTGDRMFVAIAAGAALQVADPDLQAWLDRVHSAKAAYEQCFLDEAQRQYQGKISLDLERAVAESCRPAGEAWLDVQLSRDPPAVVAKARPDMEKLLMDQTAPTMASLALKATALKANAKPK